MAKKYHNDDRKQMCSLNKLELAQSSECEQNQKSSKFMPNQFGIHEYFGTQKWWNWNICLSHQNPNVNSNWIYVARRLI